MSWKIPFRLLTFRIVSATVPNMTGKELTTSAVTVKLVTLVSPETAEAFRALAKENHRTLAGEMRLALDRHLKAEA